MRCGRADAAGLGVVQDQFGHGFVDDQEFVDGGAAAIPGSHALGAAHGPADGLSGQGGRAGRVRWSLGVDILVAWLLTLPAAAAIAALAYVPFALAS